MNTASINEHYTHDHDRLDELLHQFLTLKNSDRAQAATNFREFKAGLEQHIVWEEQILFPAFEGKTGMVAGPTEVMRWEHRQIRGFLESIADRLVRDDFDTTDEEAGLLAVLEPHNHKEENILYPMIDQVTRAEERAEIFARMSASVSH
ncbi:MAG TPA: hemerythrin domain-containing protein [Verrucomicrobiae bacterium]|nr:hemerythrin domain-containing protein [Verrucomicrobiae bacterium]